MRESSDLLVVTPTLGQSPWLSEVMNDVATLARQRRVVHVLVAPGNMAAELRANWPDTTVVEEPTVGGLYAAVNAGAAASTGWNWLTYINDDDRLGSLPSDDGDPDPSRADVVYGDVDYIDESGSRIALFPVCRRPQDVADLISLGVAPFTQQGTLISNALWRRLDGFRECYRLAADFDFWLRAAASGARFSYQRRHVGSFRVRAGQLSAETARVRSEIRVSVVDVGLPSRRLAQCLALCRFRWANAGRIAARIRSGRGLRSRDMFAPGARE